MKEFAKKIIRWLARTKFLAYPRKITKKVIFYVILLNNNVEIIYHNDPEKSKAMALIKQINKEQELLLSNLEALQIIMAVKKAAKVNGDIAEVGVYKGGSAKLICEVKGNKTLHLFDNFEGLPDLSDKDDIKQFYKGQYLSSFENVKIYLKEYPDVHFYKGQFPSTAEPIKNRRFSFLHLDVDLYKTTLTSLEFFYPRLNPGGIIISHDYINAPGVKKAIDDFFAEKPEPVIELFGSQCLIVKC